MNSVTVMGGVLSLAAAQPHPFQSRLRFVFTDYEPNVNKKGVPPAEAANIMSTAMYMPVKVSFEGDEPGDHTGAIPIGPIISMEEEDGRIIGDAVVWRHEFSEVIEYLEQSVASSQPVNFSWELWHTAEDVDENGIGWLRNCTVAGIAIVKVPAYAGRTPLLSFASSNQRVKDLEDKVMELEARLGSGDSCMKDNSITDQVVANDELAAELVVTDEVEVRDELLRELQELRAFRNNVEQAALHQQRLAQRSSELASLAGLEDMVALPEHIQTIITETEDSAFQQMLEVARFIRTIPAQSSADLVLEESSVSSAVMVPDVLDAGSRTVTIAELARAWRSISS